MWLKSKKEKLMINPLELRFGDTINSASNKVAFWDIPTHAIRLYQFIRLYKNWKDTHTVTFVGDAHGRFNEPTIFECTFPRAKYTPLSEWYKPEEKEYTINRYADAIPNYEGESIMLNVFNAVDGTFYDVGNLIDIVILDILGYPTNDWKAIIDFGKEKMVCSVVARAAQMKWYNTQLKDIALCRRPGGELHVERTPPALFPEHDTYLHI